MKLNHGSGKTSRDERVLTTVPSILVGDITQNRLSVHSHGALPLAFLLIATLMGWLFSRPQTRASSPTAQYYPADDYGWNHGISWIDLKPFIGRSLYYCFLE